VIGRINTRVIAWGVVAALLATAFLFAYASMGGAAEEPVIDTAAPIQPGQCAPCHLNLGSVDVPGVIFSHGNHLLTSCDACHSRLPHRGGATERIPMEVCFACHGIQHGPQGDLATAVCEDCHTKSFNLRPTSHVKDWAQKPHADAGRATGVNDCMMCHDAPADCDECHAKLAPEVGTMPAAFHSIISPRPKGPSVKVYPTGKTSMSQCVYCHPDLDEITPGRLIFAHADHIRRNYKCEACHATFPHTEKGATKPDMLSCYRCHGLEHAAQGQVATEACDRCHPKEFELVPTSHTLNFVKGEHKKPADEDPAYCAMCHAGAFCVDCHRGSGTSPNAPQDAVIPADHRVADWKSKHGPSYLEGQGACGSCHDDPSCKRCHKTVMPHPVGWIKDHAPAPGIPGEDCNVCHTDRNTCQKCHHQDVQRAELIAKNCTPCHAEMETSEPTTLKNKGFAEHASHFNVAKSKGKPYTCDDCHIGFSTSASSQEHQGSSGAESLADAGHDVRLCYGCHGSVDFQNRRIAPWPGAALCIRCHTDLNV